MSRRLISLVAGLSLLFMPATPVAANHLECNTDDPHDELPANGGRVTVLYESHLLVNPLDPNEEQIAAQLVGHIKQRAEAALTRYDALGYPVPPAVGWQPPQAQGSMPRRTPPLTASSTRMLIVMAFPIYGCSQVTLNLPVD